MPEIVTAYHDLLIEYFSLNLFLDILMLEIIELQSKILNLSKPDSLDEKMDETIV